MRIAIFSDIHGNSIALDAVLADMEQQGGVDGYWVLGDLTALGHDPVGVLERLAALPHASFIRGNADRYVITGDRPPPSLPDAAANPDLLPVLVEVAGSFAWTQGMVTAGGWFDWLAALPAEMRVTLPDGTPLLGIHATLTADDDAGLNPQRTDEELKALFADCPAGLICAGHTHLPLDRQVDSRRIINVGSVSNPLPPDLRACYTLLEVDAASYRLTHHRVEYDREAAITALQRLNHPGAGYITRHLRGQWRPQSSDPRKERRS
jgi:predicted phosphodiesterase